MRAHRFSGVPPDVAAVAAAAAAALFGRGDGVGGGEGGEGEQYLCLEVALCL